MFSGDDVADQDFGQVLTVSVLRLIALAAFFLENDDFFSSQVLQDLALYFSA